MNLIYAGIRRVKWYRPNLRLKQFIIFETDQTEDT
jgi:hypothetical protein